MKSKATGTLTFGNFLRVAGTRYKDREAIFCSTTGRRFSYGDLNQRANGLANGLTGLGLKKSHVAAFLCTNRAEIVEIYFALAKTGIIGLPLNYRLNPKEMIELMIHCEAKALLFDPWFPEIAAQVHQELPQIEHFIGMGDNLPDFCIDYEKLMHRSSKKEPDVEIFEEDYQFFNLTSGTTGLPKSYLLNHYNNATGITFIEQNDLTSDDVILTAFPIFGRTGFAWCASSIIIGARNVIHQFQPQDLLKLIQTEKVTIFHLVPTMAAFMLSLPDFDKYDLSSLRGIVTAAAPLTSVLREQIQEKISPNIYELYGLQETGIVTNIKPDEKKRKPDSVGQESFNAEVRIVDKSGNDVPQGEIGEIICRAPTATAGYFNNTEKTKEAFKDGWFFTGDLGRFDEDRYLYLSGRVKDMIISGGQNIFSIEVEDCLMKHPAIADCAVIGLPHETWGEMVTAVIVQVQDAGLVEEDLIHYCKDQLAGFKAPKKLIFSEEPLPKTPTGKVMKYVLVEKYS